MVKMKILSNSKLIHLLFLERKNLIQQASFIQLSNFGYSEFLTSFLENENLPSRNLPVHEHFTTDFSDSVKCFEVAQLPPHKMKCKESTLSHEKEFICL